MAIDEALLDFAAKQRESSGVEYQFGRLYEIEPESLTVGYFQKDLVIDEKVSKSAWTRRITGGGIVSHADDFVISLVWKPLHLKNVLDVYKNIHEFISGELMKILQVPSQLESFQTDEKPCRNNQFECFQRPVQFDLMMHDKKIVGGAIARRKSIILYQGSMQIKKYVDKKGVSLFAENVFQKTFGEDRVDEKDICELISFEKLAEYTSKYESKQWQLKKI